MLTTPLLWPSLATPAPPRGCHRLRAPARCDTTSGGSLSPGQPAGRAGGAGAAGQPAPQPPAGPADRVRRALRSWWDELRR